MPVTRILWCFGLLVYGISLQAARSEESEPKKKENTSDVCSAAPPR